MTIIITKEKYKPMVKIIEFLDNAPLIIASAGKSTLSPKNIDSILNSMDEENKNKWIIELVRRGHGSPLEHSVYVFEIICSRVTSHQIVRHRIASYTQLSQRYSDKYLRSLVKKTAEYLGEEFIEKPASARDYEVYAGIIDEFLNTNFKYEELLDVVSEAFIIPPDIVKTRNTGFLEGLLVSVKKYYEALASGVKPEDARYLLSHAVKTRLLVSMNARELIESFLSLRMCSHAQWEIRYIAWSLWKQLVEIHPEIFKYAGPRCVYYDNRTRSRPCELYEYLNGECRPEITRCPELVSGEKIISCLKHASRDPWL